MVVSICAYLVGNTSTHDVNNDLLASVCNLVQGIECGQRVLPANVDLIRIETDSKAVKHVSNVHSEITFMALGKKDGNSHNL